MRPPVLFPLFADVSSLPGVGPRTAAALVRLAGPRVIDLLWHLPIGVIDRRYRPSIGTARPGSVATMTVRVLDHWPPERPRQPYRVRTTDGSGVLVLVFFKARREYLETALPPGATRVVSGTVDRFGDVLQMVHPQYMAAPEAAETLPTIEPIYPLTAGLTAKPLARLVRAALARVPDLEEWLDPAYRTGRGWPSWHEAVAAVHAPEGEAALEATAAARARLAFDEILAHQLALALIRRRLKRSAGRVLRAEGRLAASALAAYGFRPTRSQDTAIAEIAADMASGNRMLRLLQGDVGSGKTVVAVVAMLGAVECGTQAALMAPTEVLARQHFAGTEPVAAAGGVRIALLLGRTGAKERARILEGLADGTLPLVVGTQALVQEAVVFRDLGLAVVDEQHRFGVDQRLALAEKGRATHLLVMTATPIPRTVMLALYGDLDVSRLTEKPPGRRPVDTRIVPLERIDEIVAAIGRSLAEGAKVFWVCPLVRESEALDVAAVEERARFLRERFGTRVGLLHGRLPSAAKERVMRDFVEAGVDLLVATTVIEVGVDVAAATVMVVEHAERFGLAQLHQLRGRIGRGSRPSTCLLLYSGPLGETARARLSILKNSDDGFLIAEEDLRLRGAGEILGVRQSGMPAFRLADLAVHGDLAAAARDDARLVLERDPELSGPRGRALRTLLYLFERDAAVRYIRSG
jgi:ATP-dependent DNA helicase RecG